MALCWLLHLSASVYQAQRVVQDYRNLDARVTQGERERAQSALVVEARLVRIETELAHLNETAGKFLWGAVGTMLLVVVNALLGLVVRKPKDV